ncbi:sigma-70 family RNA polymerase sigma factor [Gemella cuniculi]|uniref:sigma-70 family RNA polymerase sigma factor n=1 Tax=Gemella cuniculi TaxID=150240 RepID=UPI0003FAA5A9|nr:sigma-70 family RNA polymerase sigma factor [Gemella cuniculi]
MKSYELSFEQEVRFNKLVKEKHNLIIKSLRKVNIPKQLYNEFFSFALEGLLVSFLILEAGDIDNSSFDSFCFSTMKRKLIDEIRRRNLRPTVNFNDIEQIKIFSEDDINFLKFEFYSSISGELTKSEKIFFKSFLKTRNFYQTIKELNISKTQGYRLLNSIKEKCKKLLFSC